MRKPYWKPQHEVFVRGMLAHGDKMRAYREAYPGISPAALRQAACRRAAYPHIRQRIEAAEAEAKEAAMRQLEEKTQQRVAQQLATVYEQRKLLADIIFGRIVLRRTVMLRGRMVEVEEGLDTSIILKAIELDCRLEAGYNWPVHQGIIGSQLGRIAGYLQSQNGRGVPVRKQVATNWQPNPPQQRIAGFARPPFVTKNSVENRGFRRL